MRFSTYFLACVASAALLNACGGSPSPAPTTPASGAKSEAAPARKTRTASAALKQRFSFPKDAESLAYVDIEGLASTTLVRELVPAIATTLTPAQQKCFEAFTASFKEAAFASGDDGTLSVFRVAPEDHGAIACMREQEEFVKTTEIRGATEAFEKDRTVFATEPGFVYVGTRSLVESSIARAVQPWPPSLDLEREQYVAFRFRGIGESVVVAASAHLVVAPERMSVNAEADLVSEEAGRIDR